MRKKISFLILALTILVVFRKFFLPGPLVAGDAPYFYKEGLRELVNLPVAWISRGNTLGSVNLFLWIYPIMVIYGVLGTFLHLSNDLILRILFYFPSLIFGFCGVYFLTKYLKFSNIVIFFAALIYLINTYYLLLIDGGQVGVVLAYGLFPLVLYFLIKLIDKSSVANFLIALIAGFALTIVDFRIAGICIFTAFILKLQEIRKLKVLLLLSICLVGLSAYWIVPALNLSGGISTGISGLQTTSLLNSLLLSSPNWPANQFGQVIAPYFYFAFVPVLIFLSIFLKKDKKIYWLALVFLIFAFLAKGTTPPFGGLYSFFISTKAGSVFRDSTKFFIPLLLIGGVLIGISVEEIVKRIKNVNLKIVAQGLVFVFLLLLVWQEIFGRLNGVLGKNPDLSNYQKIYSLIKNDNGFLRDAWFTEKSPFAYHTEEKQALDAKDLVNFRPFASMNAGTGDHFNFMNNNEYLDWFKLLGIKYLVLNGNPRLSVLNKSDQTDWDRLLTLVSKDNRLQKMDIGTGFPVYENQNIQPHQFFVEKTFVVIGGDDIYQKFKNIDGDFYVGNQGFIFPEDGKLDPLTLQNIASTSAVVVFNNKTKEDLTMSFLQKYFVGAGSAVLSQWSRFNASDYLNYKYELLIRDIKLNDFDYGFGIAFSTNTGEKINFKLTVPDDGNYILALRKMSKDSENMHWDFQDMNNLQKGTIDYSYINKSGTEILNAVALIPENEMKNATQTVDTLLKTFPHFDVDAKNDELTLKTILQAQKWQNVPGIITKPGWIVFTDSYNSKWVIQKPSYEEFTSDPFYSIINGFYVRPEWGQTKILFKGIDDVRWGIYWSVISVLLISVGILWLLHTA